jgi:hypothetical protein
MSHAATISSFLESYSLEEKHADHLDISGHAMIDCKV